LLVAGKVIFDRNDGVARSQVTMGHHPDGLKSLGAARGLSTLLSKFLVHDAAEMRKLAERLLQCVSLSPTPPHPPPNPALPHRRGPCAVKEPIQRDVLVTVVWVGLAPAQTRAWKPRRARAGGL
jgi:hypothetical protein